MSASPGSSPESERGVIGLLVGAAPPELVGLLVALGRRAGLRAVASAGAGDLGAYVVANVDTAPPPAPYAVWADPPTAVQPELLAAAAVVLVPAQSSATPDDVAHRPMVRVPKTGRYDAVAPVPGFVRKRIRAVRGLEPVGADVAASATLGLAGVVAAYEDGEWWWGVGRRGPDDPGEPEAASMADTMCALADVVISTGEDAAIRALAWEAPLVTDGRCGAAIGVTDGVDALIGQDRGARRRAALELASDARRAARIGLAGRRRFEDSHEVRRAAERVADLLGLETERPGQYAGTAPVAAALTELGAPPTSVINGRVATALATLTGDPARNDSRVGGGWSS